MVSISDYFGKPSADNTYAQATTVRLPRTIGEEVLAAFDLSRFAQDTPVYFITYKKTTDPVTDKVSITNQTGWKGIVNPDNNTITNLELAPGYFDEGNEDGDFIECIPTAFWGVQLVEGIMQSLNPDGTLRQDSILSGLNDYGIFKNELRYEIDEPSNTLKLNGVPIPGSTDNTVTYVKPAGLKYIEVEVNGAGGGGGNTTGTSSSQHSVSGGGGGGGYAKKKFMASEIDETALITVGRGARTLAGAGSSGNNGGASLFKNNAAAVAILTANGGNGGSGMGTNGNDSRSQTNGGVGGTAVNGDITVQGERGGSGYCIQGTFLRANSGGSSFYGNARLFPGYNLAGRVAEDYGVGGEGVNAFTGQSAMRGGQGGNGVVIIREFF